MPSQAEIPPFPSGLPTATINTIDFDALAAGSATQSRLVYEAATGYGFFYLTNHHIDHAFMFSLASEVFSLPQDEKNKYDMGTTGHYFGYKRSGAMIVDDKGTPDQSEFYNISKDEVLGIGKLGAHPSPHPDVVLARKKELAVFMRRCHEVVAVLVRALGTELGLDPDLLPSLHRVDRPSVCQARVTHAPPVSEETICLGEHTDFGSVTVGRSSFYHFPSSAYTWHDHRRLTVLLYRSSSINSAVSKPSLPSHAPGNMFHHAQTAPSSI